MSWKPLKMSTGNQSEHPMFVATSKATKHTGQTVIPDEGYSKLINDREVLQEPLQEWSSLSVECPRDVKGYNTDRDEDVPIAQRLPEHEHQSGLPDKGTLASARNLTASEPCHILSAQSERHDLTDIQMVPDLLDPKLSTKNSSPAASGKLNGNETNPTKGKIKNVKTPDEMSIDHVERPCNFLDGTKNMKSFNRRDGRNVSLPKELQNQLTKLEDLSNLPVKTYEVEHFDEHKSISKDCDGQTSTKPQMSLPKCDADLEVKDDNNFHVAACELSNYLLAYHTWLVEDDNELAQGSSQHIFCPASEYKDNVEESMALVSERSALEVKSLVNANELNTFSMGNFKIDHSEDCTLLADSEVTFYPGESGLRTLSVDTRLDSVEIEVPGRRNAFNDISMNTQKVDAQNTAQFVPNKLGPEILKQPMHEEVTGVNERLRSVASTGKQDIGVTYKYAQWSPAETPPKSFGDSRLVTTYDLSPENNPQSNAASVTERHKTQISVGKLGSRLLDFNPRRQQDVTRLVSEYDNEQVLPRSEHERIAGKEVGSDNYPMPETKASRAASELYNCVLAKFEVNFFDDIDLLTPQGLELYVGESDYETTSATNVSVHQKTPQAEGAFNGALLKQHGIEDQGDSSCVPYQQVPCGESEEKAVACEEVKYGQDCTERTSAGMENTLYSGGRLLMRADLGDFNNFTVILEKDLNLHTENTESEEILSYGEFSSKGSCGLCHILSDSNEWDYFDEVSFVADLFDPVPPPNPVRYIAINANYSEITEPNINGQAGNVGFYNRLQTDVDLTQPNNYTLAMGNRLNRYPEDNDTKYTVHENKPAVDVSSIENPTQTNTLNLAGRCVESGLSTIEEEVSLVCKDVLESIQTYSGFVSLPINSDGDESTTLYEATFLPGIKAAEVPDPLSQLAEIPVHKNYGLVNHPTFVLPFINSIEDSVVKKAMDNESSQLPDDEEVTLVSISECEDHTLNRVDTEDSYSPVEKPVVLVNKREIHISFQPHASEFAFLGTSQSDDALITSRCEPRIDQANNRKIKSQPSSPPSPNDTNFILKPPIIERKHACQLTKCLLNNSRSNSQLISSFDGRSYPRAFPVEKDNVNNLAFVPVSAAEIAARIDNLFGRFTIEDSKRINTESGSTCDFNGNLRCSTLTSVPSTDSANVSRRTTPPRRLQVKAPELAAILLDKGIAVFDGDTQYIPQIQKPVVYCTLDCGYTFTIQLEKTKMKSLRTRPSDIHPKNERSSKLVNQWLEKPLWTDNKMAKCSKPKSLQDNKCCLGTLTPGQLKMVHIRQQKSAEQEDVKYLQNTGTPVAEKLVKYHTTRELPLEYIHSQGSRFASPPASSPPTSARDRIPMTWSHSKPVPRKRSTILNELSANLFTEDPIGYRSFPRAFKRMSKMDIPSSSTFQSRSNTSQILHIYTPEALFTVGTSSEPEEHHVSIRNGAILDRMNTSQFVLHETPCIFLPNPVKSPLFCKVYANDGDSDRNTMSSGSRYSNGVTK
ncbi:hypothetical protein CSKR_103435 [Clonorchis sinensis]|uniref:Uncharacterized protein n=1 Tax=Clonorchis sinensis TaxID=79923 RepID=A0A3R7GAA5_CLOSI|nr:hypothetical protein CSKR_103435 [Clonorchis sinensis]